MNIDTKKNIRPDSPGAPVTLKEAGNILEIRYMKTTHSVPIQKINNDIGVDLRTGEVIEFQHKENRSEDKASVAQSLRKLRDLINANLADPKKALWITLTYAENMTDPNRLYQDYRKFWQKIRRYLTKHKYPKAEYIAAAEPQGRGAWHMHCLFLFSEKAPFIANEEIAKLWGHGFTTTKSLSKFDNLGLYLTAYLGDMELSDAIREGDASGRIKTVDTKDENGEHQKKAIVKGARLHLYPPGFNLYRCSRGVKRPVIYQTTEAKAQKIVGTAPLVYEKTFTHLNDDGEIINFINFRQYNKAKRSTQEDENCSN